MSRFLLLFVLLLGIAENSPVQAASPDDGVGEPSFWSETILYIQKKQKELHRDLAREVRAVRAEGSVTALWSLVVASFLYGVFHAAGPGHGKAVITTYLLTHKNKVRQGVGLSIAAAFVQGCVAIFLVETLVGLFRMANRQAQLAVGYLETTSFALIALVGLLLCYRGIKSIVKSFRTGHHHDHHHHHDQGCSECGHGHHIGENDLEEKTGFRARVGLVLSIGIRPCSGAVLVLILCHLLNMPVAGVASVLAMSAGTALAVSVLAMIALYAKQMAAAMTGQQNATMALIGHGAAIVGGGIIAFIGGVLFQGSLGGSAPIL